jgi:large repetitive protein
MHCAVNCVLNQFAISLGAVARSVFAMLMVLVLTVSAKATPFTTTVPGTSLQIPTTYPQAGGVVVVLIGLNDNVYYQFSNPSTMYQGYNNSGTGPVAWQGNPLQIAPVTSIACGIQSCTNYFGGGIKSIAVRFSASDGDTKAADFDVNKITLGLNGTQIGNFSNILTQTTNTAGTIHLIQVGLHRLIRHCWLIFCRPAL